MLDAELLKQHVKWVIQQDDLAKIDADSSVWHQDLWMSSCGTYRCLAGNIVHEDPRFEIRKGNAYIVDDAVAAISDGDYKWLTYDGAYDGTVSYRRAAEYILGMEDGESDDYTVKDLFGGGNTRDDVVRIANEILQHNGFDPIED